jgi:hypothetical protein
LARLGAARRLEELRQEEAAIRAAFPDLDDARAPRPGRRVRSSGRAASGAAAAAAAPPKAKRQYKMSAAQKRAVSQRMKKYWAARRKAKG